MVRKTISLGVLLFALTPVASANANVLSRWQVRLEARQGLQDTAQARHQYWQSERQHARSSSVARRWYMRNMVASRRRVVAHRAYQVAYAQRVVNRHTPKPEPTQTTSSGGWAIPWPIVKCESGGSYTAQNPSGARGAYQLMPGTYAAYGGDGSWTPADQDRVAARLYAAEGTGPWLASRPCWGGQV